MAPLPEQFWQSIRQILSADQYLTDESERWTYSYDNSRCQALPDIVVFAENHDQVRELVLLCNQYQVPLIARGRGTGTTGAVVPVSGGMILSTERLNKISPVNRTDRYVQAEPGATNQAVQEVAAK